MNRNGCNKKRAIWFCGWSMAVSAAAAAWGAGFAAGDSSGDAVYADAERWVGLNGGTNFTAWEVRRGDAANVVDDFSDEPGNMGDFTLASGDGTEVGVGRDMVQALSGGALQIDVWHGTRMDHFRGVAVYGTGQDELLRWGVVEGVGYCFSFDGGTTYRGVIDDTSVLDWPVRYMLTWECLTSGLQFSLSGTLTGLPGGEQALWSGVDLGVVSGARAVGGIGVLVSGSGDGMGGNEGMAFDNLSVTGEAVPEPGTVGLLLAGAAAMAGLRRRRTGRK